MEVFEKDTLSTEVLEKNKSRLTFKVGPERFDEGINHAYNKNKSKFAISGFRSGKAPRKLIEMQYGQEVFYPEAVDYVLAKAYESAIVESGLKVVGPPEIDVLSVSAKDGVEFAIDVTTKPQAQVNKYKGLTYIKPEVEATDAEVDARIEQEREKNSRLVAVADRAAQLNDTLTLDYEGFVDGVAFEGGKAENHDLTLGSHAFIEGFEEQLIGAQAGEELTVDVRFPEPYHSQELAGKQAQFKVAVKEIRYKELPELNDDFAQDVSEHSTFEEYREAIAKEIAKDKAQEAKERKYAGVMEALVKETEVDIPKVMLEQHVDRAIEDLEQRLQTAGMQINMFLQYTGQSMESLRESYSETAAQQITQRLALEEIAQAEQLTVTDEELEAELTRLSELYKMNVDMLKEAIGARELQTIREDLGVKKASEFVLESAIADE